jgi:mannitol-1-phosphate 5-dehydrogenase
VKKQILIYGAGKIGRGFIGRLFYDSGYELYFADSNRKTIDLLNREKQYRIEIAGKPEKTRYIPVLESFHLTDKEGLMDIFESIDLLVTSVGAPNIISITDIIKNQLENRKNPDFLNWFICENAYQPAKLIKERLLTESGREFKDFIENNLGLVETQILCSGMLPDKEILSKEPLALKMQDWSELPFDKEAFKGSIPEVTGFKPKNNFKNELVRKLFTFNGLNGPVCYMGWQRGYKYLHQAANAPELSDFIIEIMKESKFGLIKEFGFDKAEQDDFHSLALQKYKNEDLQDPIERNARDLKKKLGINERLFGPALLCLKNGMMPVAYAAAIAAAIRYEGSDDEGTREVREFFKLNGIIKTLTKYTGLEEDHQLIKMVSLADQNKSYIFNKWSLGK